MRALNNVKVASTVHDLCLASLEHLLLLFLLRELLSWANIGIMSILFALETENTLVLVIILIISSQNCVQLVLCDLLLLTIS